MKRLLPKGLRPLALAFICLLPIIYSPQASPAQNPPQQRAAPATQTPAQEWLSVNVVRIKPEMTADYIEFVKNERVPAFKKAGLARREAWVTGTFGEGFEFTYVTPITNFAQYDNP